MDLKNAKLYFSFKLTIFSVILYLGCLTSNELGSYVWLQFWMHFLEFTVSLGHYLNKHFWNINFPLKFCVYQFSKLYRFFVKLHYEVVCWEHFFKNSSTCIFKCWYIHISFERNLKGIPYISSPGIWTMSTRSWPSQAIAFPQGQIWVSERVREDIFTSLSIFIITGLLLPHFKFHIIYGWYSVSKLNIEFTKSRVDFCIIWGYFPFNSKETAYG